LFLSQAFCILLLYLARARYVCYEYCFDRQSWCLPFGKGEFQHHGGITLEVLALSNVSVTFADWHLCTSIDYSVEAHRVGLQAPPGSCAQK
jgi:hypothetical protein